LVLKEKEMVFNDRQDAGRQLASKLQKYKGQKDCVVVGLARGGVVTAFEVAMVLKLPLSVVIVRKIGAPYNEELALGAIAESGEGIFNEDLISVLGVSSDYLQREVERQKKIAQERARLYRGEAPAMSLKNKVVILVDDGIATGASMRVAIKSVKAAGAQKVVLAAPVAAPDSLKILQKEVDEVVCLSTPLYFEAVGRFYRSFDQTGDEELIRLLEKSKSS
jgi:putative phosphoribosyl transferase